MWIDHMFAYLCRWGTLARFNSFALEGSNVRLKRLLRNIGGVSLLHNKSGLQCVVDNHTLDDHLRKEGWELTSRDQATEVPMPVHGLVTCPAGEKGKGSPGGQDREACIATKDAIL